MTRKDAIELVAGFCGTLTVALVGLVVLARLTARRDRRRERARRLAARAQHAARTKGGLDELLGGPPTALTYEDCAMAPLEPVVVPDACEPGRDDEPEATATGWDPRRRQSGPMVHLGSRLVHRTCADARRDARPGDICEHCAPALAGVGS